GLRRRHPADAGARARTQLHQPAGRARHVRGRAAGRRDRHDRLHRPGDRGYRPMSTEAGTSDPISPDADRELFGPVTVAEAREIIARYPQSRSALLPMLHLVQSKEGHVSSAGIAFCAHQLGLSTAEVDAVVTFYTMYKRNPCGQHLVSVCTNTLCAALGGDS